MCEVSQQHKQRPKRMKPEHNSIVPHSCIQWTDCALCLTRTHDNCLSTLIFIQWMDTIHSLNVHRCEMHMRVSLGMNNSNEIKNYRTTHKSSAIAPKMGVGQWIFWNTWNVINIGRNAFGKWFFILLLLNRRIDRKRERENVHNAYVLTHEATIKHFVHFEENSTLFEWMICLLVFLQSNCTKRFRSCSVVRCCFDMCLCANEFLQWDYFLAFQEMKLNVCVHTLGISSTSAAAMIHKSSCFLFIVFVLLWVLLLPSLLLLLSKKQCQCTSNEPIILSRTLNHTTLLSRLPRCDSS